uniref:Reverse transcriptase zinc-binding domain-containing protein n=1 Tax=Lactuca sativa TaxID=4236 RepID=A0A9R1V1K6_LACSA|nr:hypothetical protein LSAT_V11C700356620 [Lactuca sativa]
MLDPGELAELFSLNEIVLSMQTSNGPDTWKLRLSNDGIFHIQDLRHLINMKVTRRIQNPTVWIRLAPLNVICFVWRSFLDMIPTSVALANTGVINTYPRNTGRVMLDPGELAELFSLNEIVLSMQTSNGPDTWKLRLSNDGIFHIQDLRHLINMKVTRRIQNPTVWIRLAPLNVICFVWRSFLDMIPTSVALAKRKVNILNTFFHHCDDGLDDSNHSFLLCPFSNVVLWGSLPNGGDVQKNAKFFLPSSTDSYGVLYSVNSIIVLVFNWVKYKGCYGNCNWGVWCCNPFDIL